MKKSTNYIILVIIVILSSYYYQSRLKKIEKQKIDFLNNDEEILKILENEPLLIEYPHIRLWPEPSPSSDIAAIFSDPEKVTKYNRAFVAWMYSEDSVPPEENYKLYGYVNMEKEVYIWRKFRGDAIIE